jgi:hypothetical protein
LIFAFLSRLVAGAPALYTQLREKFSTDVTQPEDFFAAADGDELTANVFTSKGPKIAAGDLSGGEDAANGRHSTVDTSRLSSSSSLVFDTSAGAKQLFEAVDAFRYEQAYADEGDDESDFIADPVELPPAATTTTTAIGNHYEASPASGENPLAASGVGRIGNTNASISDDNGYSYAAVTARLAALGIDCQQVFGVPAYNQGYNDDDDDDDDDGDDSLLSAETRDDESWVDGSFDHERAAEELLRRPADGTSSKKNTKRTGTAAFALPVSSKAKGSKAELHATGTGGNAATNALWTSGLRERLASAAKKASSSPAAGANNNASTTVAYRVNSVFGKTRVEKYKVVVAPPQLPTTTASSSSFKQPYRSPIELSKLKQQQQQQGSSARSNRRRKEQEEEDDGPTQGQFYRTLRPSNDEYYQGSNDDLPSLAHPFSQAKPPMPSPAAVMASDDNNDYSYEEGAMAMAMAPAAAVNHSSSTNNNNNNEGNNMTSPFPVRRLWLDHRTASEAAGSGAGADNSGVMSIGGSDGDLSHDHHIGGPVLMMMPSSSFADNDALTDASFHLATTSDQQEGDEGEDDDEGEADSVAYADERSVGSADRITKSTKKAQRLMGVTRVAGTAAASQHHQASSSSYPRLGVPLSERKHKARPTGDGDPVSRFQHFDQQRKKQEITVNRHIEKAAAVASAHRIATMAATAAAAASVVGSPTPAKAPSSQHRRGAANAASSPYHHHGYYYDDIGVTAADDDYALTQLPASYLQQPLPMPSQQQPYYYDDYSGLDDEGDDGLSYTAYGEDEELQQAQRAYEIAMATIASPAANSTATAHTTTTAAASAFPLGFTNSSSPYGRMAADVAMSSLRTPASPPQPPPAAHYYNNYNSYSYEQYELQEVITDEPEMEEEEYQAGDEGDDDEFFYDAAAVTATLAQQHFTGVGGKEEEEVRREADEVAALLRELRESSSSSMTLSAKKRAERVADSWLLGGGSGAAANRGPVLVPVSSASSSAVMTTMTPQRERTSSNNATAVTSSPMLDHAGSFVDYQDLPPIQCLGPVRGEVLLTGSIGTSGAERENEDGEEDQAEALGADGSLAFPAAEVGLMRSVYDCPSSPDIVE